MAMWGYAALTQPTIFIKASVDMALRSLQSRLPATVSLLTLLLLAAPFIGLAFATSWHTFGFASGDGNAIAVSLGYSLLALVLIIALGTPLAWWLARHRVRGAWLIDALLLLALLTPPLALGLLLAAWYGPLHRSSYAS